MPVQATPVSHGGALPLWYPERPGKDHPFSGKGLHLSLGGGGSKEQVGVSEQLVALKRGAILWIN